MIDWIGVAYNKHVSECVVNWRRFDTLGVS